MSHCSPSTWDVTYVFPDALQFTHKHPFEAAKSPLSHWQTCPDMFVASSDLLLFAADSCWNHGLHGWFPRVLPAHVGGSQFHESVNWTYDVAAIVPPSTVGGEKWRWHRNSWKVYVASRWGPFWVGYHKFLNVNSVLFNQYSILCQKKIPIFQCSHAMAGHPRYLHSHTAASDPSPEVRVHWDDQHVVRLRFAFQRSLAFGETDGKEKSRCTWLQVYIWNPSKHRRFSRF